MRHDARAFTLLELLVVMGIIAIVVAIIVPAMSSVRDTGRTTVCQTHLREMARGWDIYADENDEVMVPGRMFNQRPKGPTNPGNWFSVGNGLKYRPRWPAVVSAAIGVFPYDKPEPMPGSTGSSTTPNFDRQDYDNELLVCPTESTWVDERNYAYGYNYQFLGNARQNNDNIYYNFPVRRHRVKAPGSTVLMADSLGTAAGFSTFERRGYRNDGNSFDSKGNHGWALDPPRLTKRSDRGTGDNGSPRTAVDTRHQDKANAAFADGHVALMSDEDLGYRKTKQGRYVDLDPSEGDISSGAGGSGALQSPGRPPRDPAILGVVNPANNRLFSGTGRDKDPPVVPGR